jgi:hypothetical protein
MDAITRSRVGSLIDFGAIFGNFFMEKKMGDYFLHVGKGCLLDIHR